MKIYLAGPISGQTFAGCTSWRKDVAKQLKPYGILCIDPMRGKDYLKPLNEPIKDSYDQFILSSLHAITTRDRWDVQRCDMVLINFTDATKVSIGTCIEVGWANAAGKPIIVVMKEDNMHWHGILRDCALAVVPTLEQAISIIIDIAK